jgi:hypothetical protein
MRVVELVPTTPLDAHATFTLFWRPGAKDMFSSTFHTGDGLDASPPFWEGAVATPIWERYPGWAPLMRSPRKPWIEVTLSALHDDMTSESDLVIGVFPPNANGAIDFEGPPALLLPLRQAKERIIAVTRGQTLEPPTLVWGPDVTLEYPGTEQPPAWLQKTMAGTEGVSWFGRKITLSKESVPFVPAPFWRGPASRVTDDYVSRALPAVLVLGENDTCGGYFETFHLDEQRPRVSVGLQAVDMAGQRSSPVTIAVDLRHPIVPWRDVASAPW